MWYFSFSGVLEFVKKICSLFAFGFFAIPLSEHSREDSEESIGEFFDVELHPLSSSSEDDFFDSLSLLSETETLSSPDFFDALSVLSESDAAAAQYRPWLTGVIVALYAVIFIATMGINNCPKHTFPTDACFPAVFGRFALQPTGQNPLLGPSRAT
jgi:hypothetical protein